MSELLDKSHTFFQVFEGEGKQHIGYIIPAEETVELEVSQ